MERVNLVGLHDWLGVFQLASEDEKLRWIGVKEDNLTQLRSDIDQLNQRIDSAAHTKYIAMYPTSLRPKFHLLRSVVQQTNAQQLERLQQIQNNFCNKFS